MAARNPAASDVDASLRLLGGRTSLAVNEMARLLADNFDSALQRRVDAGDLPATVSAPVAFLIWNGDLEDTHLNHLIIRFHAEFEEMVPSTFAKVLQVLIFWPQARATAGEAIAEQWDAIDLAGAILLCFQGGQLDPNGRRVWNELTPLGEESIEGGMPDSWKEFSGPLLGLEVKLNPGGTSWS